MDMFWTTQYQMRKEETITGLPTLKDVDIQTIHEAFQVGDYHKKCVDILCETVKASTLGVK